MHSGRENLLIFRKNRLRLELCNLHNSKNCHYLFSDTYNFNHSSKIYFSNTEASYVLIVQCTVVDKGIIIEILDFELGAFSENLRHIMTWGEGIFGLSLQKKKF